MFSDDDLLPISGLQHLSFCERQWALIHIDRAWDDNILTVEGKQLHEFVHEQGSDSRSGVVMARSMELRSIKYGLYGVADLVEFRHADAGIALSGRRGLWQPYPVEYKRGGTQRFKHANGIQLCAQAVCLEEMFGVSVGFGAVYYGQPRRRDEVAISSEMRRELECLCARARELSENDGTPRYNIGRHCKNCSLAEQCMPDIAIVDNSVKYVERLIRELSKPLSLEPDS